MSRIAKIPQFNFSRHTSEHRSVSRYQFCKIIPKQLLYGSGCGKKRRRGGRNITPEKIIFLALTF
jgi:hypothetical protein